jgi:AbrB family looped-hinge helix DNA binding protein
MRTTVSEKGQITIPKPLRDSLALVPGTELEFEEHDGGWWLGGWSRPTLSPAW